MKGFIKFAKDDVEAEKWIATDKVYTVAGWENSERMNFRRNAFKNKSAPLRCGFVIFHCNVECRNYLPTSIMSKYISLVLSFSSVWVSSLNPLRL